MTDGSPYRTAPPMEQSEPLPPCGTRAWLLAALSRLLFVDETRIHVDESTPMAARVTVDGIPPGSLADACAALQEEMPVGVQLISPGHYPGPGPVTIAGRSLPRVEASCIRPGVYKAGGRIGIDDVHALAEIMRCRRGEAPRLFGMAIGADTFWASFLAAKIEPTGFQGAWEFTAEIERLPEKVAHPRQVEAVLGAIKVWRDDYRREGEMACVEVSPMPPAVILHELQGLPIETPPAHLALLTERAAPPERDRTAAEYFAGKGERYSPAGGWER